MDNKPAPTPPTKAMPTLRDIDEWRNRHRHNRALGAIAAVVGVLGIIAMLALVILWIMGIVSILSDGHVLGYFKGESAALTALFFSCVFYAIFMPLQGLVAWAVKYAANKPNTARMVPALLMWVAALAGIAVIIGYSPIISEGVQLARQDYMQTGRIGR